MKQFGGFPARMEFAAIPSIFFSTLLPEITDVAELKTTLYLLAVLLRKRGSPRYVTRGELLESASLVNGLRPCGPPEEVLATALKMAAERGTIINVPVDRDGKAEDIYLLNTDTDRQAAEKIRSGELALSGLKPSAQATVAPEPLPDIFTLYEQNIGMLTPIIAEELGEAIKSYPEIWLRDAIREAADLNKRNWRYIARILERWSAEGKQDGAHQRNSKEDPDKYIKGKYGHMVRR